MVDVLVTSCQATPSCRPERWQGNDVGTLLAVVKMMYGFGDSDKPLAETVSARGPSLSISASLRPPSPHHA